MTNIVSLADKLDEMIELVKQKQKEVNKIIQSKDQKIKDLERLITLCVDRLENNDPYFNEFISDNDEFKSYLPN